MKCPRDAKTLVFVDDGRHLRDRCPGCEGILLDREDLAGMLGKAHGRPLALAAEKASGLPEGDIGCPRDGAKLRRLDHRGVELDICPECGSLWLDAGELDKIRASGKARGGGRGAALAGAAATGAAATEAHGATVLGAVGELARDVAVEGAIEVVFEFAAEALGALLS